MSRRRLGKLATSSWQARAIPVSPTRMQQSAPQQTLPTRHDDVASFRGETRMVAAFTPGK